MALLTLLPGTSDEQLLDALADAAWPDDEGKGLAVRVHGQDLPAGIASYLATRAIWTREQGGHFMVDGNAPAMRLLDRWGVLKSLGSAAHPDVGRADETLLLEVREIMDGPSVFEAINDLLDLVLREFSDARAWLPAFEWAVSEVVDNIDLHAEAPVPGVLCARYVPSRGCVEVGIADVGQGILSSLRPALDEWDGHGDALRKALQRGVTRDISIGQGNGLAGALEITRQNRGDLLIWTGDVVYRLREGQEKGFHRLPAELPGTGVMFRLYPSRPVRLEDTFIGDREYSHLDTVAGRLSDGDAIRVTQEVSNTSTRATARRLRNKVLNVLPSMDTPIVLDFAGVERASSSFLDELFGRMAIELGLETMQQKVKTHNMIDRLQRMTSVVIDQRLEQEGRA